VNVLGRELRAEEDADSFGARRRRMSPGSIIHATGIRSKLSEGSDSTGPGGHWVSRQIYRASGRGT